LGAVQNAQNLHDFSADTIDREIRQASKDELARIRLATGTPKFGKVLQRMD